MQLSAIVALACDRLNRHCLEIYSMQISTLSKHLHRFVVIRKAEARLKLALFSSLQPSPRLFCASRRDEGQLQGHLPH
jgi:hypothetical protein